MVKGSRNCLRKIFNRPGTPGVRHIFLVSHDGRANVFTTTIIQLDVRIPFDHHFLQEEATSFRLPTLNITVLDAETGTDLELEEGDMSHA